MKTTRSLAFALLLSSTLGCVTSLPVLVAEPAAAPVRNESVAIRIPAEDIAATDWAFFGLVGVLFPMSIDTGTAFESYAAAFLAGLFSKAEINGASDASLDVRLDLVDSSLSGFSGRATLHATMVVVGKNGQVLLEKNYEAKGPGHAPIYWDEWGQRTQVITTSTQAFSKLFASMRSDLSDVPLQ